MKIQQTAVCPSPVTNLRKQRVALALIASSIVVASGVSGCTTLSEEQLDAREYRRVDFEEKFKFARSQCLAKGGRMVIDAKRTLARDGIPHRGDRYFCS